MYEFFKIWSLRDIEAGWRISTETFSSGSQIIQYFSANFEISTKFACS